MEMGFSNSFILLVMGLVCNGTSKVHINGLFNSEILLDRGVCQGCPLVALLFALTSQPLMLLFKKWEHDGFLEGILIGEHKEDQFLYQIFANDTSAILLASEQIFQVAIEVIDIYERISSAWLNLEKSTIVPLDKESLPDWYSNTRCKVARLREVLTYLGCPMG